MHIEVLLLVYIINALRFKPTYTSSLTCLACVHHPALVYVYWFFLFFLFSFFAQYQLLIMPPKRRYVSMPRDDLAWEENDKETDEWERSLHKAELYRAIASLIKKYRPGEAVELHTPISGGYNVFYRLEYKDGSSAAMRIPSKGIVRFPEEKVRYEVATMRCIAARTTIPVPKIYHFGTAAENPTGLGPFIIMDYVDHEMTMSEALKDPALEPDERHELDPNISAEKLEFLYRQMANIVLQLSTLTFPRIGSLVEDKDGQFSASGRPLIQNMNHLIEFTDMPPTLLPSQSYSTSDEWYSALADMHMAQLVFQHNDAVVDEDDARDKYVARQLFRRLASKGQLTNDDDDGNDGKPSMFPLFSSDLRPSNVLIDKDLKVVGVIDWEFAYAAPPQFSFDPPWWLLLKCPDEWPGAYVPWMEAYEPRLETFLRLLEEEEEKKEKKKKMRDGSSDEIGSDLANLSLEKGTPLSQRMRESWRRKTWMISYAARNSWEFDGLFWRYLDPVYFGPNEDADHRPRLGLLSQKEMEVMESLVKTKMEESKERTLVRWNHDDAAAQLAKFMI
ncbi:phosphotransferase family protein [Xylaria scruposa]|nr:phosphotransferase family protein [Xylaria scruposa]